MAKTIEFRVPDLGDDKDVPVIELLVQPGDVVKKDQGLVTLESDKATMEVPASAAGKVLELKVRIGDTVSADIRGSWYTDVVREVTLSCTAADGAKVTATVGGDSTGTTPTWVVSR